MEQNYYDPSNAFSLHERREMNKISLDTFAFDKENNFDFSAGKVIQELKNENKKSFKEYNSLNEIYKKTSEKQEEHSEGNKNSEISLMRQIHGHFIDITYREDELFAFSEMKIIYAFKHLEINIKRLINSAYPGSSNKGFYRWDNLIDFLNSKSIIADKLVGFKEINQLRIVNNALKHSATINEQTLKIPEFKRKASFSYIELDLFYERIKPFPTKFLSSLSAAIYDELYLFDEKRLKNMAMSVALRMDEENAIKFMQILKSCY